MTSLRSAWATWRDSVKKNWKNLPAWTFFSLAPGSPEGHSVLHLPVSTPPRPPIPHAHVCHLGHVLLCSSDILDILHPISLYENNALNSSPRYNLKTIYQMLPPGCLPRLTQKTHTETAICPPSTTPTATGQVSSFLQDTSKVWNSGSQQTSSVRAKQGVMNGHL